jgi:hypothetical protein
MKTTGITPAEVIHGGFPCQWEPVKTDSSPSISCA